jgi:RNA polymerase sporulation-specific sigma factor
MFLTLFALFTRVLHMILGINTQQKFPPPLSAEEEHELFLCAEDGNDAAREKLILHNLRLVSHIVRKYYSSAKNQEDLISIGTIGLVKAVDTFSVRNGAKFATYAAKCIQNEILMHFRAQKKLSGEVSINDTIDIDKDGNPLTYMDILSLDDDIAEKIDVKIKSEQLMNLIEKKLCKREKQIIFMRYALGFSKPLTQREIAEKLGISRSYVSRIENSAISKLRENMK